MYHLFAVNDTGVDTGFETKTIESNGITLAYSCSLNESCIAGVLQSIRAIIGMSVVIGYMCAKIVIDRFDFLVIRFAGEIELTENRIHCICHFCFLRSSRIIERGVIKKIRILT